jgi:hypothetical protein
VADSYDSNGSAASAAADLHGFSGWTFASLLLCEDPDVAGRTEDGHTKMLGLQSTCFARENAM